MGVKMDLILLSRGIKGFIGSNNYCDNGAINTQGPLKGQTMGPSGGNDTVSNYSDHNGGASEVDSTATLVADTSHASRTTTGTGTSLPAYEIISQASTHNSRSTSHSNGISSSNITMSRLVCTLKKAMLGNNDGIKDELQTILASLITKSSDGNNTNAEAIKANKTDAAHKVGTIIKLPGNNYEMQLKEQPPRDSNQRSVKPQRGLLSEQST
jgi:hypothetical protein